ncbi:MAG: transcriptional regulator [Clostridiales bacterium]|nr:transcriptional regulator [Clostridiales bacterium]
MKYYERFLDLGCFTRSEVSQLVGNPHTADTLLRNYKRKGYLQSVRRDLYVAISLETKQAVASRYQIASKIMDGSYVSHHSAFEYYGVAHQVFFEVYVSGKKRFLPFVYDDLNYRYVAPGINEGLITKNGVTATDIERTIIDMINDFEKIAGFEELLRCLELIPSVNEEKLLYYLSIFDKHFLYQKTGYILSYFQKSLRLSDNFFTRCHEKLAKSVRYLHKGISQKPSVYDRRWQLFTPKNLLDTLIQEEQANATI